MPTREPGKKLQIHRRRLPHWQIGGRSYFVTWCLLEGILNAAERSIVLDVIERFHRIRYVVNAVVVMPDHVHLLIHMLEKQPGTWWSLTQQIGVMKGVSAREINTARGRRGALWQDESYDRVNRTGEFEEKWEYIRLNPVRDRLCDATGHYDWLRVNCYQDGWLPRQHRPIDQGRAGVPAPPDAG